MKKLAIFFLLVIIIISTIWLMYFNYKNEIKNINHKNYVFDGYYQKEINGNELTSIINRAVDNNIKNEVSKDKNEKYVNNHRDSISIELKILDDNDRIYTMEKIYNGGTENFARHYGNIIFKCTKIEYHKDTKLVKYMLFEQITQ